MILSKNHPYVKKFAPEIRPFGDQFRVVWRQFDGQKCDEIFKEESEALGFVEGLKKGCEIVEVDGMTHEDIQEANKNWKQMKGHI